MNSIAPAVPIGVGLDTARFGHHVSFLRDDLQPAANGFTFRESHDGYQQLRNALDDLQRRHGHVHFHIRIDAAGQYAANLEHFVRALPFDKTVSVGQPKQNKDYRSAHFPKRKSDDVDSRSCARFAMVEQPAEAPPTPPAFAHLAEVAGSLQARVQHTTRLVNQLHNRLARAFPELATIVPTLAVGWVLRLLAKYPTAEKVAAARLSTLAAMPHVGEDKARQIHQAARQSVASAQGPLMAELVRQAVNAVRQSLAHQAKLEALLEQAYDALPAGDHVYVQSVTGIGKKTAAALVAKMISIDRFDTPADVVGYFGLFPEENTSGVDKHGRRVPPGTMQMCRKGNDLVRGYLWNAAKSAIVHNRTVRRLYARKKQAGKSGDVALGHCMQKLLHLAFAVWKTGRPFVDLAKEDEAAADGGPGTNVVGRKEPSSERQAVTTTEPMIPEPAPADNPASSHHAQGEYEVDFAEVRQRIGIEQVLREVGWWDRLHGRDGQLRGPCPLHSQAGSRSRSFSVNVNKNVFHCFDSRCGAHGNVLDLWSQLQQMSLVEAAKDLAERFGL